MNLAPSIYSLYRQSRYARTELDGEAVNVQNRRELFAVAAVALTLKHDPAFQQHFLRKVCNVDSYDPNSLRFEVQPAHHADLKITLGNASESIVIEFKVGATLQSHQNPDDKAFFGPDGYRTKLKGSQSEPPTKTYVVIDGSLAFTDDNREGLLCLSRTWNDLDAPNANGLWADLLDSLGTLGVPALQFGALKGMDLKNHTCPAVNMHKVLQSVSAKSSLASDEPDISSDGDYHWYGFNIAQRVGRDFKTIAATVASIRKESGWFGYECAGDRSNLAIYFYCGTKEAAEKTKAFLDERVDNSYGKPELVDDTGVIIRNNHDKATGDAEWFHSIFNSLRDFSVSK